MKILIIAYYTPPLGLSGVLRVTKLAKYLPEFGIEPVFLTVMPIAYYHYDYELLREIKGMKIYRAESIDPARLTFLFWGKNIPQSAFLLRRKDIASRSPQFQIFPDSKITFLPFAYQLAKRIIPKERISLIFATSPPYTNLLLGVRLKRYFSLPLIADFRDPFPSGYEPPPQLYKKWVSNLVRYIVKNSDAITVVQERINSILGIKGQLLSNGYDLKEPATFRLLWPDVKSDQNNLLYIGNFFENEALFLEILSELRDLEIRLDVCGAGRKEFLDRIKKSPEWAKNFHYLGILPHRAVMELMQRSAFLLYIAKPNQEAGIKLYEYLGAKRPIIYLGREDTEAARIIKETDSGIILKSGKDIKLALEEVLRREFRYQGVERYSFHQKASELSVIIRRLISQ